MKVSRIQKHQRSTNCVSHTWVFQIIKSTVQDSDCATFYCSCKVTLVVRARRNDKMTILSSESNTVHFNTALAPRSDTVMGNKRENKLITSLVDKGHNYYITA